MYLRSIACRWADLTWKMWSSGFRSLEKLSINHRKDIFPCFERKNIQDFICVENKNTDVPVYIENTQKR